MAIHQGTFFSQAFTLMDSVSGAALNVAGWTFKAELKVRVEDDAALVTLDSATGGFTVIDAVNGRVAMNFTSVQTAALPVGGYVFDVLRTDAAPGPVWLFAGKVRVAKPVTTL